MNEIDLGKIAITNGGVWNKDTFYAALVAVSRNGQSYLSWTDSVGIDPGTDTKMEHWLLLAERGESLYQMYVRTGRFKGTEAQFLDVYAAKLKAAEDAANKANEAAKNADLARDGAKEAAAQSAELDRQIQANENIRQTNEGNRQQAAIAHNAKEKERIAAEQLREEKMDAQLATMQEKDAYYFQKEKERNASELARANEHMQLKESSEAATLAANNAAKESKRLTEQAVSDAILAAQHAETAATTIDNKINPVVDNDKLQDTKIGTLQNVVSNLQRFHGADFCVGSQDVDQLAPEFQEIQGNQAFALAWYPVLTDMTDNAGPRNSKHKELKRNNWFRDADGNWATVVCVTPEDYALCDAELYLDNGHTQKYCDAMTFDAAKFYEEHGMNTKLYGVDGVEISHIRRPWETTNKDLSVFVARRDDVYLCDTLVGRSGKTWSGVFANQTTYDGARFDKFKLERTGINPSPVCTVNNKTRSFFYLMDGESNCQSGKGEGGCCDMFYMQGITYPRINDMQQVTNMQKARANNADPQSPIPFAEGGFHALNTFLTCMEVGYGTRNLYAFDKFSSGISTNDSVNESSWLERTGVRIKNQGTNEWRYYRWGDTMPICYNTKGGKTNVSNFVNWYYPKMGCCEAQIAASYATERNIPAGQEFTLYGFTYRWEHVAGTVGLDEGEMNCRLYKLMRGTINGYLDDGTPQAYDCELMLRVGLMQGVDTSGDIYTYFGGGYEQVGEVTIDTAVSRRGNKMTLFLEPDQTKWAKETGISLKSGQHFDFENHYIKLCTTVQLGDGWMLSRHSYSSWKKTKGGSSSTGVCGHEWSDNYWGSLGQVVRVAVRLRLVANYSTCAGRSLYAYYSAGNTSRSYAGSAQVLLERSPLQAEH